MLIRVWLMVHIVLFTRIIFQILLQALKQHSLLNLVLKLVM